MENLRRSAKAAENIRAEEEIRRQLVVKRKSRKHKERTDIIDSSASVKQNSKNVSNHVDVISEGIEFSGNAENIVIAEGSMAEIIDVSL